MRRSHPFVIGITLAVAVAPRIADAQTAAADSLVRHVDQVFARFTPDGPGCAVAVYRNGQIALAKGYGLANLEYGTRITPATPFIAGSVSKQFTAAAIALLVEEKRIALTDDVRKYVPELRDYGTPITVGHLVHHTSGLRDWWELVSLAGLRNDDTYAVQDVLDMTARQQGLNFAPGERYLYSNTGYILLGMVVQRATGKTLREFAAERIFTPLGMSASHFQDDHTLPVKGRAYAYSPAADVPGGYRINVWNNDLVGQGGVMTTVLDLAKWDDNFRTGRVGGAGFLARQLERGKLNSGSELTYAFGLQLGRYRGLEIVEHTGSTGGYRSAITRFPSARTSIAALCNVSTAAPSTLIRRVADHLLAGQLAAEAAPAGAARGAQPATDAPAGGRGARGAGAGATPPATPAQIARLAGRYHSEELDAFYELVAQGTSVVLRRPRGRVDSVAVRDSLTLNGPVGTLRFSLGPDGRGASFVLMGGRVENIRFVRRP
jgi:CubicO group peptidase (beta-lactamase class C family)